MSWRRLEASTEAHRIANYRVTMTSRVDYHYEVPKKVLSIGHVGSFFSIFHLTPVTYLALLEGGTTCVIYCTEPPVGIEPSLYQIKFFYTVEPQDRLT